MLAIDKYRAAAAARSRSVEAGVSRLKAAGNLTEALASTQIGPGGGFTQFMQQRGLRERYNQFRGWLYSGINAIALEAASQPFFAGLMDSEELPNPENDEASSRPRRLKEFHRRRMPSRIKAQLARTNVEVLETHDLLDVLEQPNPMQNSWQFTYSWVASLALTGWSYVVRDEVDGRHHTYAIPTNWAKPDHQDGLFSGLFIIDPKNPEAQQDRKDMLTREQFTFAHLPNPANPFSAIAPAGTQVQAIRIDDHIQTTQEKFFKNGVFPSVLVRVGKNPHPEAPDTPVRLNARQKRQVYSVIRKQIQGIHNFGNPAILDGLIAGIERFSSTQEEIGWEKSEDKVRTRILSAIGVHPYILGEPVSVGGYAQAAKIEERFCKRVNSYLGLLSVLMTNFLGPLYEPDKRTVIWWEECAPHDPQLFAQNMREGRKNGDVTRDEFRAYLNLPPAEEEESRSKLLDAVGGMTGANQLLTSMGQGLLSTDTVAQLFSLFFQISEEQARAIVGTSENQLVSDAIEELSQATQLLKLNPRHMARLIAKKARHGQSHHHP